MELRFTILLPVIRTPELLPVAIDSVLTQELTDFELFIIGDGAPEPTMACAQGYVARDARVKVFPFPKGEGVGEAYRHAVLEQARGRYVAHIADDDLWFPNHLEEMEKLLREVDFGNLIHVEVRPDGSYEVLPAYLASPKFRQRMLTETYNALGDTVTGYRMTAYRSLPDGWAPAPKGPYPDLKMWRKFLRRDNLTFDTRMVVTALIFATDKRNDMSLEERAREMRRWYDRTRDPCERAEIAQRAWASLIEDLWHRQEDREARLIVIHALQTQLKRLQNLANYRLPADCPIDFSERGNSALYTILGWSDQEGDRRWSDGKEAVIRVRLEPTPLDHDSCVMRMRALAFGRLQRVTVLVDDVGPVELTVDEGWRDYDVPIGFLNGRTEHEVRFLLPDAHSPKSIGLSEDARILGIALSSLTFLPCGGDADS